MRPVVLAVAVLMATPTAAYARTPSVIRVQCTSGALRAAVTTANGLGGGVIRLAPRCTYSFVTPAAMLAALPQITGNITIIGGPSTAVRRDPAATSAFGIIDIASGGTLRARGFSIQNGDALSGGGINNAGSAFLDHMTLTGNNAQIADGGGFSNTTAGSFARITRSLITANMGSGGGGLSNSGRLTIADSRVTANSTPIGGGGGVITGLGSTTNVVRTTIDHNVAGFAGGGILNLAVLNLDHTLVTFNLNSAVNGFLGGGVFNVSPPGVVTSRSSIVRGNSPTNCVPPGTIRGCAT